MFKEIDYFGTKIYVSKNGKVIWNNQLRNIYKNADGYSVCSVKIPNRGWRSVRVARLVALAYIPNPNNLPEVNHKDYDRTNSNVDNLEWISRIDNIRYSKCNMPDYHGRNNPNYGNKKLSERYRNNKQYAIEKQSRKGLRNGRCRKIKMYYDDNLIHEFDYIEDCCNYILKNNISNCKIISIRKQIDESIKRNRPYKKHYTFVKE